MSEHTASTNALMKGNMEMIDDINKQRESNKVLKLRVQSDMGELRRVSQVIGAKGDRGRGLGLTRFFDDPPDMSSTMPMREGQGFGGDMEMDLEDSGEDLTETLYRNRQRLLALRSAVVDLEARKRAAPAPLALPPLDSALSSLDDRRASTVFITAAGVGPVPLLPSGLATSPTAGDGPAGEEGARRHFSISHHQLDDSLRDSRESLKDLT